jgi:hypothetical protein
MRTARSRTSGENFGDFFMAPFSRVGASSKPGAIQYAAHVAAGHGVSLWDQALNRQIYLGDNDFVQRMLDAAEPGSARSREVPKAQRPKKTMKLGLTQWLAQGPSREEALRRAHTEGGLTMTAMAAELGLTVARVSQLVSRAERGREMKSGRRHDLQDLALIPWP